MVERKVVARAIQRGQCRAAGGRRCREVRGARRQPARYKISRRVRRVAGSCGMV